MELRLLFLTLGTLSALCLASVSAHTVESDAKIYWKAKLGDTPMPKVVLNSLKGMKDDVSNGQPITKDNLSKYVSFFNEKDIKNNTNELSKREYGDNSKLHSTNELLEYGGGDGDSASKLQESMQRYRESMFGYAKSAPTNEPSANGDTAGKLEESMQRYRESMFGYAKSAPTNEPDADGDKAGKLDESMQRYRESMFGYAKSAPINEPGADGGSAGKLEETMQRYRESMFGYAKSAPTNEPGADGDSASKQQQSMQRYRESMFGYAKSAPTNEPSGDAANSGKQQESMQRYHESMFGYAKSAPTNGGDGERAGKLQQIGYKSSATSYVKVLQDSGLDLFFLEKNLIHPGGKMKLDFTTNTVTKFLPHQVAMLVPFSYSELSEILNLLSIKPTSNSATVVEKTLKVCEAKPVKGENKYCTTSLENLVDFVISNVGSKVKAFSTTIENDTPMVYKVEKAQKISSEGNLVCHGLDYPYAVFYCHNIKNTDSYIVSLVDANGKKSKAAAVCHKDTSSWNPGHLAFQLLKIKPGSMPVCHYLSADTIIWAPTSN